MSWTDSRSPGVQHTLKIETQDSGLTVAYNQDLKQSCQVEANPFWWAAYKYEVINKVNQRSNFDQTFFWFVFLKKTQAKVPIQFWIIGPMASYCSNIRKHS